MNNQNEITKKTPIYNRLNKKPRNKFNKSASIVP